MGIRCFFMTKEYDVFWMAANDLKAPAYLQPRLPTPLIHEQMWKDRPWLNFSALEYAGRLNMHTLGIITAGVLDRFRDVRILLGHMVEHM